MTFCLSNQAFPINGIKACFQQQQTAMCYVLEELSTTQTYKNTITLWRILAHFSDSCNMLVYSNQHTINNSITLCNVKSRNGRFCSRVHKKTVFLKSPTPWVFWFYWVLSFIGFFRIFYLNKQFGSLTVDLAHQLSLYLDPSLL